MIKVKVENKTDKGTGTSCEGPMSGRCFVEEQRQPGGNPDTGPHIKIRKKGGREKNKRSWTKAEREVLWECYYISIVMDMWNRRDIGIRTTASILSQIKCLIKGGLLSEFKIERNRK